MEIFSKTPVKQYPFGSFLFSGLGLTTNIFWKFLLEFSMISYFSPVLPSGCIWINLRDKVEGVHGPRLSRHVLTVLQLVDSIFPTYCLLREVLCPQSLRMLLAVGLGLFKPVDDQLALSSDRISLENIQHRLFLTVGQLHRSIVLVGVIEVQPVLVQGLDQAPGVFLPLQPPSKNLVLLRCLEQKKMFTHCSVKNFVFYFTSWTLLQSWWNSLMASNGDPRSAKLLMMSKKDCAKASSGSAASANRDWL